MFSVQMMRNMTTAEGISNFRQLHRSDRRLICEQPVNLFQETLKDYPEGDPVGLRRELGSEEYLKLVDEESNQDNSDD
jgi:hypothetical protein